MAYRIVTETLFMGDKLYKVEKRTLFGKWHLESTYNTEAGINLNAVFLSLDEAKDFINKRSLRKKLVRLFNSLRAK